MKKISKILKNKKGVTLVELAVGMVIFSIVTASAIAVMVPMMRAMTRANVISEYNALLDNLANNIISEMSMVSYDTNIPNPIIIDDNLINIVPSGIVFTIDEDGILLINGFSVLPKQYYRNNRMSFEPRLITNEFGTVYEITLTLSDGRGYEVSRTYSVRPLALNQYNG